MRYMLSRIDRALYQTAGIARIVSGVVLGVIAALTVVDIALRYIFNMPLAYAVEVVELALSIVVFFGIVVCTAQRGHVNIGIVLDRLTQRGQAVLNCIFYLISACLFGLMAWQLVVYAMRTLEMERVSMMLKVPFYPLLLVTAFAIILTTLLFISQAIRFMVVAVRKWI